MRAIVAAIVAATIASGYAVDFWWKNAVIYQIYPRSFKDSNSDGIGDLNGITSKLPYLRETGIDAIWLSPIYLSPMYDFGYDITDYREIAPEYGTMEDFDNLMKEAKRLGIRVVLDYVPNHTSNESDWFVKSAGREPGYEDYYIWADGVQDDAGTMKPPSNWVSLFRKSAWEYNEVRGQYYLHQFVIGQPDLNYRSATVQQEMKDVLSFWLEKGVSGFRVDAINMMYEVNAEDYGGVYPDEPLSGDSSSNSDDYGYLDHIYTRDQPETYDVVYDWRDLLDTYTAFDGESKVLMTEAYTSLPLMIRYYGNEERNGSMPFNFLYLEQLNNKSTAQDMKQVIDKWMTYMPDGKTANWVNGNHDQSRLASRLGEDRVDAMNMLALLLPGLTITYQGEEIGMTDGYLTWEQTRDPQACNTDDPINYWRSSRDPARTPYHWDNTKHAGFSDTMGDTWLPVASNYEEINLAAQINVVKSHYRFYKDVVAIKKAPAVRYGDLDTRALSEYVLVVTSLFRKSAWEYNEVRGQYYLHQFVIGQPDLNYRSATVQQEMKDVLSFWLEKGVSGFRVDAINMMYEVNAEDYGGVYPDEPLSGDSSSNSDDYGYLDHIYTRDQPETYDVVYDWRDLLDTYTAFDGESKVLMTEAYTSLPLMIRYYGNEERNGSMPFNFLYLEQLNNKSTAQDMKQVIDKWMTYMPDGKTANWVNGNHDQSRLASRLGEDRVDAMNMLALLLPGLTITYQGEEIGMTDGYLTWEQTRDPQACNTDDPINYWRSSRDPARTPYHWDNTKHAGFSDTMGDTWLPVASNYEEINLAAQINVVKSHYRFYKDVVAIKKAPAVRYGDLDTRALSEYVLVVTRLMPGQPAIIAIMNLSESDEHVDLSNLRLVPRNLYVVASGVSCQPQKGILTQKDNILVSGHCALVLQSIKRCC